MSTLYNIPFLLKIFFLHLNSYLAKTLMRFLPHMLDIYQILSKKYQVFRNRRLLLLQKDIFCPVKPWRQDCWNDWNCKRYCNDNTVEKWQHCQKSTGYTYFCLVPALEFLEVNWVQIWWDFQRVVLSIQ